MTVALLALLAGGVLLYAGVKGKSVTSLLQGDSQTAAVNTSLAAEPKAGG